MQKHKGNDGKKLLSRGKIRSDLTDGIPGGDEAVNIDETIKFRALHHLKYKYDNVDTYDCIIDYRVVSCRNVIADGNHLNLLVICWLLGFAKK